MPARHSVAHGNVPSRRVGGKTGMSDPLDRRPLSPLTAVLLIARREFVTRVRTRVFVIGTAIVLVALAGYLVFQELVINKQGNVSTYKVAYLGGEAQTLAVPLAASAKALGLAIERHDIKDQAPAGTQLRECDPDGLT